jgi:hypothetical protein
MDVRTSSIRAVLEGFKHTSTKIPSPQKKQNQNFKTSGSEIGTRAKLNAEKTMRLRIKPVRTRDEDLVLGEYRRRRRRKKSRGLDDSVLLVGDIGVSRGLKRDLHGSAHATPVERVLNEDLGNGSFRIFLGNGREKEGKVTVHFLCLCQAQRYCCWAWAGPNLVSLCRHSSLITFLF